MQLVLVGRVHKARHQLETSVHNTMKPTREKKHFKKSIKKNDKEREIKTTKNAKPCRISKPQKSSKHKKIKAVDPFYVGPRSADRKKHAFNLKPKKSEYEQDLSNAEKEFQEMKHLAKTIPKKKLKGRKNPFERGAIEDRRGMTKSKERAPKFVQGKRESENQFLRRMDMAARTAISQAQFEDKFDIKGNKSEKVEKERTKSTIKNTKRLQEKKERKKERKQQRIEDNQTGFEKFKDEVKFGEVAMEPPRLAAVPRKASKETSNPGVRPLLLKEIMQENASSGQNHATTTRKLGKTIKRKKLSPAQQIAMDVERDKAINIYREMKAKKMAMQS